MTSRNYLIPWMLWLVLVAPGSTVMGQFAGRSHSSQESSSQSTVPLFAPPTMSLAGEQIASWTVDPWMTATRERQILDALHRDWRGDLPESPLDVAARVFSKEMGDVPVRIDVASLEMVGLMPDEPVSLRQRGISIGAALTIALEPLALTWVISRGVVTITTAESAEVLPQRRLYDVTPLVASGNDFTRLVTSDRYRRGDLVSPSLGLRSLSELIKNTVSPDRWEERGGTAVVEGSRVHTRRILVISAPSRVHFQVDALLKRLNRAAFPSREIKDHYQESRAELARDTTSAVGTIPASNRLPRFGE